MSKLPTCSDYLTSILNAANCVKAAKLANAKPCMHNGRPTRYTGGFCIVFPFETTNGKKALRCWHAELSDTKEKTRKIADELKKLNLPYFVDFEYIDDAINTPLGLQPIVLMDWADGVPLKRYISENLYDKNKIKIEKLADEFLEMVKALHKNNISHGDLQHGNILVTPEGKLKLVDYDSMCVPSLVGSKEEIKGLKGYQHPVRFKNEKVTPKADYFSELVIYLSLKALSKHPDLWDELQMEDTETMLFTEEDINNPSSSDTFRLLKGYKEDDITNLVNKLEEFIKKNSLDDLSPLEDVVVSLSEKIAGGWKSGNGYNPANKPKVDYGKIADDMTGWTGGNGYKPEPDKKENYSEIAESLAKWK